MHNTKILVVDDDPAFCRLLEQILSQEGAQVITAGSGQEALRIFDTDRPDLVMLDVMMPEEDGFETCRRLRKRSDVPIIMLTAFTQAEYVVMGFTCGADDYIAKPFHLTVLLARIDAVLRRAAKARPRPTHPAEYLDDYLAVDPQGRHVWVKGERVQLSPTEYSLLVTLVERAGQPMTCQQILERVWGRGRHERVASVHATIARLRHKIEPDPQAPRYVVTETGVGYRFEPHKNTVPAPSS